MEEQKCIVDPIERIIPTLSIIDDLQVEIPNNWKWIHLGPIGRCVLVPDDFGKGSINQHILIIKMVDDRLRFYIHKLLCSPYAQRYIKDKLVGDKDGFSGGRCKLMLIPLPPLAEQQRIVKKIDEVLSAISMAG